jgi:hypothetical protein
LTPSEKGVPAPTVKPDADVGGVLSKAFTGPATFDPGAAFLPGTPKHRGAA